MSLPEIKLKSAMGRLTITLLAVASFTPSCEAFFRNLMIGNTAMARVDPIVDRGQPAKHVHHLSGGGNLNLESTGETLAESTCTNSILTQDKSAYWTPWLYFQHDNGSFQDVNLALGLTAYYKYEVRGNTGGNVKYSVFPTGLKMLTGSTDKREWNGPWPVPQESLWGPDDTTQAALAEKAMGFNCMNYAPGKNEPTFAYPYLRQKSYLDANCPDGIRAEIVFPSCWDGKNLDSTDHKSHVAFPTLIQDGVCPETHPVYLPIMFFETIWNTQDFKDVPGTFVFGNGDPTGYGYHADFIAAWDDGVQEQVRDSSECTGLGTSGVVESCPVFDGHIQTQPEAAQCKLTLPDEITDEQTDGILASLPGDIQVKGTRHDPGTNAPGDDAAESYAPSTSIPETRSSVEATRTSAETTGYYASAVTSQSAAAPSEHYSAAATIPSPAPTTFATHASLPVAAAVASGSTKTTTYTSGRYVVEMVLVEMYETVTATTAPTMTQTVVINGSDETPYVKERRSRHARKHIHSHQRHF